MQRRNQWNACCQAALAGHRLLLSCGEEGQTRWRCATIGSASGPSSPPFPCSAPVACGDNEGQPGQRENQWYKLICGEATQNEEIPRRRSRVLCTAYRNVTA